MSRIIGFCNQKGGTGKTTSIVNLATFFALAGRKVLLVDLDPQANATSGLGKEPGTISYTIYDLLIDQTAKDEVAQATEIENLFLISSTPELAGAEIEIVKFENREFLLKRALSRYINNFDFILIDAPPSLGLLTLNILTASQSIIIPVQCEYYALEGLSRLMQTIKLVKERLNPSLEIEGVLLTMADFRTNLTTQVIEEIRKFFGDKVYQTIIPRNVKLSEAPSFGKPIYLYEKNSLGARAYFNLACEILKEEVKGVYDGEKSIRERIRSIDSRENSGETSWGRIHLY